MVLEKTLESPLDCKEIKWVNLKGNQPWIFIGRTDVEAPIIWPRDAKSWIIRKDPDAGKDWRQEEKGTAKDETVGWYHRLNGHEFEQTPGDGDGQGSLLCYNPLVAFLRLSNIHPNKQTVHFLSLVLYSRFSLVIHLIHSSVSMLIPVPQCIPPIVFLVVHMFAIYIYVSILLYK